MSTPPDTSDREITSFRVLDAPRALVFDAFTDARHISNWWGPRGFTTMTSRMDARTGGVWEHVMHGPDGRDYDNRVVYVEVVRPERIVYDHISFPLFRSTITFEEQGAGTKVSVRMLFESSELRGQVDAEHGAAKGLHQMLERLGEHLAAAAKRPQAGPGQGGIVIPAKNNAPRGTPPDDLVIHRTLNAPRELVFRAWTDPKHLTRWWGPDGFTSTIAEWVARPGGAIRLDMHAPDGAVYPMGGAFVEVVPPERLVFKGSALDGNGKPLMEIMNTVTFVEDGGRTRLALRTRVVRRTPAAEQHLDGQKVGWTQSLVRLAAYVDGRSGELPAAG